MLTKQISNKKKSSVEWLIAELGEYFPYGIGGIEMMVSKAKAMHKEEIKKAWVGGKGCLSGEQYYNETFGGNNEQQ